MPMDCCDASQQHPNGPKQFTIVKFMILGTKFPEDRQCYVKRNEFTSQCRFARTACSIP